MRFDVYIQPLLLILLSRCSQATIRSSKGFVEPPHDSSRHIMTDLCNTTHVFSTLNTTTASERYGYIQTTENMTTHPATFNCKVCVLPGQDQSIRFWFKLVDVYVDIDQTPTCCVPEIITFYAVGSTTKYRICRPMADVYSHHQWSLTPGTAFCIEFHSSNQTGQDYNHAGFILFYHATDVMSWWECLAWTMGFICTAVMVLVTLCGVPYLPWKAIFRKLAYASPRCRIMVIICSCGISLVLEHCWSKYSQPNTTESSDDLEYHPGGEVFDFDYIGAMPHPLLANQQSSQPPPYPSAAALALPEYKESRTSICDPPGYEELRPISTNDTTA